jgi:hypothetical protein
MQDVLGGHQQQLISPGTEITGQVNSHRSRRQTNLTPSGLLTDPIKSY